MKAVELNSLTSIDLISDAAFAALETEELVSLRKVELEAANLQDAARVAARRHDWNEVDKLVAELDVLGVENAWVKESTKKLREYATDVKPNGFLKKRFISLTACVPAWALGTRALATFQM